MKCVLVIPCYNEAARCEHLESAVVAASKSEEVQWLFVNDGSTDLTAQMIGALSKRREVSSQCINLERNLGKAEAVRRGLRYALDEGADFVAYWDADLATPLEALSSLLETFETNRDLCVAMASRIRMLGANIARKPIRHYAGRVFATAASLTLGLAVYDTQCGAKVFRANDALRSVLSVPFQSRWIFDVEVLARYCVILRSKGIPPEDALIEVPIAQWRDVRGSKLRVRDFVIAPWQLASIYWRYRWPGKGEWKREFERMPQTLAFHPSSLSTDEGV